MVQDCKQAFPYLVAAFDKDLAARKASYDAVQKHEQERKLQAANDLNKFGAWGPLYKNKLHFAEMHIC